MLHPGIVPQVPEDPGTVRWAGPAIGAHNEEVFSGLLGLSAAEIVALRQEGVC
jgi:crotonobetainyl-CoA:carnitine CoA-transferase CaiB-like acyl-CoA transferase